MGTVSQASRNLQLRLGALTRYCCDRLRVEAASGGRRPRDPMLITANVRHPEALPSPKITWESNLLREGEEGGRDPRRLKKCSGRVHLSDYTPSAGWHRYSRDTATADLTRLPVPVGKQALEAVAILRVGSSLQVVAK